MTRRIELCALHRLRPHLVSCSTGVEAPLTREFQRRKRCSQQCSGSIKTCAWACARQSVLYPSSCAFARLAACKTLASQLHARRIERIGAIQIRYRLFLKASTLARPLHPPAALICREHHQPISTQQHSAPLCASAALHRCASVSSTHQCTQPTRQEQRQCTPPSSSSASRPSPGRRPSSRATRWSS